MKYYTRQTKTLKKLSPLVTEISWTNNLLIITACKIIDKKKIFLI